MMTDDTTRSETEVLIMEATYAALRRHGYADLSVAQIADEFEKSKSLLYYHYDSKDDLIAAFLSFAADQFMADIEAVTAAEEPVATVRTLVDHLLTVESREMRDGQRMIIELRGQAVSEPRFRERFTRVDDRLRERIRSALAAGVERGVFDAEVDPEDTAGMLYAALTGAMVQQHTADGDPTEAVRRMIHRRLDRLVVD
jgi:AcrR family transcriptional regulator